MDKAEKRPLHYWIILLVVIASLVTTAYLTVRFLFLQQSFSSNTVGISRVDSYFEFAWVWADVHIEGKWQEIHYYTIHFDVRIKNSKTVEMADLRLVIDLKLKSKIVDSGSKMIGTLKAGESRNVKLDLRGVPHIYLYDKMGNFRNPIGIVTLYSGNEELDQKTVTW